MSAIIALGLISVAQSAKATTYTFNLGSLSSSRNTTFTMGTWSLSFDKLASSSASGCYYTGSGSCSNVELVADITRGVLTLTFSNITSGKDLVVGGTSGADNDLFLNFSVSTPTSSQKINQVSMAITGTSGSTSNIKGTEYLCASTVATCTSSTDFSSTSGYAPLVAGTTSPASYTLTTSQAAQSLSVSKDLFSTSNAYHIVTMTQRYVSNPEPVSMTVLGVGLAGLAFARRRTGRRLLKAA
ncbi:MAG TPA: PEP-CTERM sorting domain-containing protein [Rhodopila sp.]|jgi:hypothetical protein|nr:PEP-CTERM sorting domain-containing protein [Rhodopila sp.]